MKAATTLLFALIAGCSAGGPSDAPKSSQKFSSIASYLDSGAGHNPPVDAVTVLDLNNHEDSYISGSRTIVTTRATGDRSNSSMVSTDDQAALHLISRYLPELAYSAENACGGSRVASISFGGGASLTTYDVYGACVKKSIGNQIYYAPIDPSYSNDLEVFYTKALSATDQHRKETF